MISGNNLAISVSRDLCQHQAIRWPVPFHLRLINSIFLNAYYRCAALASWNSRAGYLSAEWHSARKKSRLLPTQGERRLCHRGGPLRPGTMPPRDTNRRRRIARAHSDHSLAQGRWSEKRVELKFLLGEIRLCATQFSMFTLDAHFTDLLGNPEQAAMAIEQIPPTADGFPRAFPAGARSSAASVPPSRFDPVCANAIPALLHRDAVFV